MTTVPPLRRWQSHKKVWAEKIIQMEFAVTPGEEVWRLANGSSIMADVDLVGRFKAGDDLGYYVRYDDGYQSWSPSKAFEEGYVEVKE